MVTFGQKARHEADPRHADRTTLAQAQPPAFPKLPRSSAGTANHREPAAPMPATAHGRPAPQTDPGTLDPTRAGLHPPELPRQHRIPALPRLGLKVSDHAVAGQIARMGLCRRTSRTKWTPDEDEVLRTLLPKHSHIKVAKIMHRSVNAVVVRAKRLEVSRRERDDWFTLADASQILGSTTAGSQPEYPTAPSRQPALPPGPSRTIRPAPITSAGATSGIHTPIPGGAERQQPRPDLGGRPAIRRPAGMITTP